MSTVESDEGRSNEPPDLGRSFWIAVVVGGAPMLWGGYLYLDATADLDRRVDFGVYLVGAAIVHDLVVAPVICVIGLITARLLPGRVRAPVQAGFIASGAVLLVAFLPLRGTADATNNDTIQPLDYTTATLTALAIVWIAAAAWLGFRLLRGRAVDAQRPE